VCVVGALAFYLCPALTFADEAPPTHTFLQGGIEHSETLPALPDDLHTGKPITALQDSLAQRGQKYYWYKAAPWMAGTWQTESVALSDRVPMNKPNSPMRTKHEFLQQVDLAVVKDDQDQFWNCQSLPRFSGPTHQGAIDSFELTRSVQSINPEALKSHVIEVATNPSTKLIEQVNQEERINLYIDEGKEHLRIEQSEVFFDAKGKPYQKRRALITAHRVGSFKQTSDLTVFESFVAFIKEKRATGHH
jgi:hypothetical protein